jgi:hydroxypyruvate reductase
MYETGNPSKVKAFLRAIYDEALAPALPANAMKDISWPAVDGVTYLLSVGKAATQMACAVYNRLPADARGYIVTRSGYAEDGFSPDNLTIIEASHPVPDTTGAEAGQRILADVGDLGPDDLLLVFMSGGASALLPAPADGLSLAKKQTITRALLRSGAPISEMNMVRKHLSAIKGGRLAKAAYPARTHMVAISDIPGDDIAMIGSGPTVADPSTYLQTLNIIDKYSIELPTSFRQKLAAGEVETPKPGAAELTRSTATLCARPADMCAAAVAAVSKLGYEPIMLGDALEGDAIELGQEHAEMALEYQRNGHKIALISGGEATVTVKNKNGRGGRCSAYLLSCAIALKGAENTIGFAADSDGIDGSEDNAGAYLWPSLLDDMGGSGAAASFLKNDDSYRAFEVANALMMTGPSGTNVNDLRVLLVN